MNPTGGNLEIKSQSKHCEECLRPVHLEICFENYLEMVKSLIPTVLSINAVNTIE